jgi:type IV pilus assembly protein PilA
MKNTTNKKSGFTLVELMIVAAIIAILAAIVIPLLANNKDRAIAAEGQNIAGAIGTAVKIYYAEKSTVPAYTDLPQIVRDEVSRAKYFGTTAPVIGGTGLANLTVTVTANATGAGTIGGKTLTFNMATTPTWSGTMVGTGSGQVDL